MDLKKTVTKSSVSTKKLFGYCERCGWFMYPYRYRTNTDFIDDEKNYEFGCHNCQLKSEAYWADAWSNLYSYRSTGPYTNDRSKFLCLVLNGMNTIVNYFCSKSLRKVHYKHDKNK